MPAFRADKFQRLRNGVYVGTVAFAALPLAHWSYNCWRHTEGVCDPVFFQASLLMLLLYGRAVRCSLRRF